MEKEIFEFVRNESERVRNIIERIFPTNRFSVGKVNFRITVIENMLVVLNDNGIIFKRNCLDIEHVIKSEDVFLIVCNDYSTFQINLKEN